MNGRGGDLRIRLDRTICDGFGVCAKHAPEYFSLDDWGYAALIGNGAVPEEDRDAVMRALMDCPVHAIMELGERRPDDAAPPSADAPADDPVATLKTEDNEATWGFTR
jgi:ferredoxin